MSYKNKESLAITPWRADIGRIFLYHCFPPGSSSKIRARNSCCSEMIQQRSQSCSTLAFSTLSTLKYPWPHVTFAFGRKQNRSWLDIKEILKYRTRCRLSKRPPDQFIVYTFMNPFRYFLLLGRSKECNHFTTGDSNWWSNSAGTELDINDAGKRKKNPTWVPVCLYVLPQWPSAPRGAGPYAGRQRTNRTACSSPLGSDS